MVDGQVQPVTEDAINLYDLSPRAGFEKSMATFVELFAKVADLTSRSLDGFRGQRIPHAATTPQASCGNCGSCAERVQGMPVVSV
jgi:hypothetical protein